MAADAPARRSSRKRRAPGLRTSGGDERDACPFFTPNYSQLKELWDFDNTCCQKYFGVTARRCHAQADDDTNVGISQFDMQQLKNAIELSWKNGVCNFSIIGDPESGLSLHVHRLATAPLRYTDSSPLMCGWMVVIPTTNVHHLYERSPIEKVVNGVKYTLYMGGPISYSNWISAETANIVVQTVSSQGRTFLTKMINKRGPLTAGTEIRWDYGTSRRTDWEFPTWYLKGQCCYLDIPKSKKEERARKERQERRMARTLTIWNAKCTLCGFVFSSANKEGRSQAKMHYIRRHPDFLGSNWDGIGEYAGQPIDGNTALQEADLICQGLKFISEELHANYIPACTVFSEREFTALIGNELSLMEEFKKRELMYLKAGCVIVRGCHRVKGPACLKRVPLAAPFCNITFAKNGYDRNARVVPQNLDHEEKVQAQKSALNTTFSVLLLDNVDEEDEDDNEL